MPVELYSMEGCGFCTKAKQKLEILGFPYTNIDIHERIRYRPGWREDGSVELLAAFAMADNHAPLVRIGGEFHGYSKAMQVLKRMKRKGRSGVKSEPSGSRRDRSGEEQAEAAGARAGREEARALAAARPN